MPGRAADPLVLAMVCALHELSQITSPNSKLHQLKQSPFESHWFIDCTIWHIQQRFFVRPCAGESEGCYRTQVDRSGLFLPGFTIPPLVHGSLSRHPVSLIPCPEDEARFAELVIFLILFLNMVRLTIVMLTVSPRTRSHEARRH